MGETKSTGINAIPCLLMVCAARGVGSPENRTQSSRFLHIERCATGRQRFTSGLDEGSRGGHFKMDRRSCPGRRPGSGAIDKPLHLWITHAPQVAPVSDRPWMGIDAGRGETVGPVFRHRPRSRIGSARPARAQWRRSHGGGLMRSFDWLSFPRALARIGRWFDSARQSLLARSPLVRWSFAAAVVSILIVAGYLGTASLAPAGSSYLASGRRFSPDDLVKVRRALERQRIDYRIDDQRRVAVSADEIERPRRRSPSSSSGPRSLDDLRDQSAGSSVWESPHDKELREQQRQEKILESMINELPGIVGSFVLINRPSRRLGLRPARQALGVRPAGDRGGSPAPVPARSSRSRRT